MSDRLWAEVGECFDTDDGSLPGIDVAELSPTGVASVYAMLRRRSRLQGGPPQAGPPEFWSRVEEASFPVDSVPNAAALVAAGQAEAFHIVIAGVVAGGVELPALGVFVFADSIELDYRMGHEWGSSQVAGFFELLVDCCALDPGATVVPAENEGPPYSERFVRAWLSYSGRVRS